MPQEQDDARFAVCIQEAEPDLRIRSIYRVPPDARAGSEDCLRIVDDSGEDYLYPSSYFIFLEVPDRPSRNR